MKKFKKIAALLLAMIMTIAMAVPSFAAGTTVNENDPTETTTNVTVEGLALDTSEVTAYKYLDASYANGVVTYSLESWAETAILNWATEKDDEGNLVDSTRLEKVLKEAANSTEENRVYEKDDDDNYVVDVDKVIKVLGGVVGTAQTEETTTTDLTTDKNTLLSVIAAAVKGGTAAEKQYKPSDLAKDATSWTATFTTLNVGAYVVLATDSKNVYNPMQVSVGLGVDSDGAYNYAYANNTVAKYSTVPFSKEIQGKVDEDTGKTDGEAGDDYQIGEYVPFVIKGTIPNYDLETYKNITYKITDTLSDGLDLPEAKDVEVVIKSGGSDGSDVTINPTDEGKAASYTDADGNTQYYVTVDTTKRTITIDLSSIAAEYIGKVVEITYSAKLNANAETGFDANTNTAKLTYSNGPEPTDTKDTEDQITKSYTFAINGNIIGNQIPNGKEITKTGETPVTGEPTEYDGLGGAYFGLYDDEDCTNLVNGLGYNATDENGNKVTQNPNVTDSDGYVTFNGLQGNKVYYLKETTPPAGYSLNDKVYSIEFVPTFDKNGNMISYKVKIDGKEFAEYNYDSTKENGKQVTVNYKSTKTVDGETVDLTTTEIRNTKLTSLPSTGGIGTTIFTIAGCAIMIAAGGMLIVSRRKKNA